MSIELLRVVTICETSPLTITPSYDYLPRYTIVGLRDRARSFPIVMTNQTNALKMTSYQGARQGRFYFFVVGRPFAWRRDEGRFFDLECLEI